MSPEDELEMVELGVKMAGLDEEQTMFDPDTAPKVPDVGSEATMHSDGAGPVDIQRDTPVVDDLATFDLTGDDLYDIDL